jgi:hypothetical protein
MTARSYVTAGTGNAEAWLAPPRRFGCELKAERKTRPNAVALTHAEAERYLYSWNSVRHHVLITMNACCSTFVLARSGPSLDTRSIISRWSRGAWKTVNHGGSDVLVLHGYGIEEYSKLTTAFTGGITGGAVIGNLFIPSQLDWADKGFTLRQETRYPEAEDVTLTVTAERPEHIALRLRIPGWLQSSPTVKLNNKVLDASAAPGSYLTLRRVWERGDKVEMRLPMHLHVEVMPDDPQMQAFLYGPLVLAGDLGAEGLTEAHIIGPNLRVGAPIPEQHGSPLGPTNRTPPVPDLEIPSFKASGSHPSSWIMAADKSLTFRTSDSGKMSR